MSVLSVSTGLGDAGDGIGARLPRIDGPAKVRGEAVYALDKSVAGLAHAVIVSSTVAAGRIRQIDAGWAEAAPGVLLVMTPYNTPALHAASSWTGDAPAQREYRPLDVEVRHYGQQIAAVVAETLEQATEAAALVRVHYDVGSIVSSMDDPAAGLGQPVSRIDVDWGDAAQALDAAPVRLGVKYETPRDFQMPLELHGLIAEWEGNTLTVFEGSQWLDGMARTYAEWFGIPFEHVRIVSPYIGGAFGSKALALAHGAIASIAARRLVRPVKLVLSRKQVFSAVGGRPATRQILEIGATAEGKLLAIRQNGWNETAIDGAWVEPLNSVTSLMYHVPNFSSRQRLVPVHTVLPGAKRAPGESPSAFGLESAIDELAHAVGVDPLRLRLLNDAPTDPHSGKPWSSRRLREAFAAGAGAFGWQHRNPAPRSMRNGHDFIGWGLAAGSYPVRRSAAEAMVRILADGNLEVRSSTSDMGTGAYTILAQTVASVFRVPAAKVRVVLGDSRLPRAPVTGGSQLSGAMTGAVDKAARAAKDRLIDLALTDHRSPLRGVVTFLDVHSGTLYPRGGDTPPVTIAGLLTAIGRDSVEVVCDTLAENGLTPTDRFRAFTTVSTTRAPTDGAFSIHSWCAHFIEVVVDAALSSVRVRRVVTAFDAGLLYNSKLAESQIKGGVIMGIGQALLEGGVVDAQNAHLVNDNLGDYLPPTCADIPQIQVISVGEADPYASVLGGKTVGELGIVGVAPAIANAVFHATGKRIRRLPISISDLV